MLEPVKDFEERPYYYYGIHVKTIENICGFENVQDAIAELLEYHRALSRHLKDHEMWKELGPFIETKLKDLFSRQKQEEMEERILKNKVKAML